MSKTRFKWLGLVVLSITALLVIGGCGGSGSSTPPVAKAAVSGTVSFPSISNLVAKRVGSVAADTGVTVKVFNLSGGEVASVNPTSDDSLPVPQRIYSYSVPNLDINTDYVIKVTRGSETLRKLVEKKDVVAGNVPAQTIDAVSTVAVMIASQKLSTTTNKIVLGEIPPAGTDVTSLSQKISTDVKPSILEASISAAVNGASSTLTESTASYANLFNIVVTAVLENKDPNAVAAGTQVLGADVKVFSVTGTTVTTTVTTPAVITTTVANIVKDSSTSYVAPTTVDATTYTTLAKQYLAVQDISNASLNYEKALVADPNNPEANFGGAITSGMMLIEDPDVQAIITKWGAVVPTVNQVIQGTSPIKLPFDNMTSIKLTPKSVGKSVASAASATTTQNVLTAFSALKAKLPQQKTGFKSLAKSLNLVPSTAPSIGEMQTLIDNVIIPRIDKINARLAIAEAAPSFTFTVTTAMQGNPLYGTDVVLDAGELYTLDAALNIFQVLFKMATSYNFDIPAGYTYDTIGQDPLAMINSASVFTLKAAGAAKMTGALVNAKAAAAKAKLAYDKVVTRTLGQGMFDLSGWTQLQKDDFVAGHTKVTAALAGPYDVLDSLSAKIVTIDATKFFTNPLTRASLPTFGYDVPRNATLSTQYGWPVAAERTVTNYYFDGTSYVQNGSRTEPIDCNIEPTSDLPDYALNGILPGNTAANNFADFNGILPVKGGALLHGLVSGVPSYNFAEPQNNLSYESDGTSLFRLKQLVNTSASPYQLTTRIQQIDTATGLVTNITAVDDSVIKIVHADGQWWAVKSGSDINGQTLELYKFTNATTAPWTLSTTAFGAISLGNAWPMAISGSGNVIYYALGKYEFDMALGYYTHKNEIHKLDVTTGVDTVINLTDDSWINSISFYNGSIYTSGDGIQKRDASTGAIVASYANGDFQAMLGGYFYTNNDGKLIKYAGAPAGGTAKAALAKYFGF